MEERKEREEMEEREERERRARGEQKRSSGELQEVLLFPRIVYRRAAPRERTASPQGHSPGTP